MSLINQSKKLRCLAEAAMGLLVGSEDSASKIWPDLYGGQSSLWMVRRCLNGKLIAVSPYECDVSCIGPCYHLEITDVGRRYLKKYASDRRYLLCVNHRLSLAEAAILLGVKRPRASQLLQRIKNISSTNKKIIFTHEMFNAWDRTRWNVSDISMRG